MRIGINGLGRIGLNMLRVWLDRFVDGPCGLEIVAINDVADLDILVRRVRHDPIRGPLSAPVRANADQLWIGDRAIRVFRYGEPADIPWRAAGVDVVIEATGRFRDERVRGHIAGGGACRVVISAAADGADAVLVMGVNAREAYDPRRHFVISASSCGVNALALMAMALQRAYGLQPNTASANIVLARQSFQSDEDTVTGVARVDPRLGRAAENIIPLDYNAADLRRVVPEVGEVLLECSLVPTPVGSKATLWVTTRRCPEDAVTVNARVAEMAEGPLKGWLGYGPDRSIVSGSVRGNPASCWFDPSGTEVTSGNRVKVRGWFDNEWGYAGRLLDIAALMADCLVGV